jgi:dextranase
VAVTAASAVNASLRLELLDIDRVVERHAVACRLARGTTSRRVRLRLPTDGPRGYGIRATLDTGRASARARTVIEAIDGWWEAPRHAAITDHRDPDRSAAAIRALREWHVTVVQLYDWMYRHYRYRSPGGRPFADALGQPVTPRAVTATVHSGHAVGIASLAYGSVYGAEREYIDAHPDQRVFDVDGRPLSLGGVFYITDLRPGTAWRRRLLREYAGAIRRLGADGIHMDTYGPPHTAIAADGEPIDFAAIYPGLIEEAARSVDQVESGRRVLFNCVDGFPLEAVAAAPTAAHYLELWPPDTRYRDVVAWIDRANALEPSKAVIIAAYVSALRTHERTPALREGAIEATLLLSSMIFAAGAFHHVLAEGDRLLVEGYYPAARRLNVSERRAIQACWSFQARYLHVLSGRPHSPVATDGLRLDDSAGERIPVTDEPIAGAVWARAATSADGSLQLSLIDLIDQAADIWDDVRQPSPRRAGWRIDWPGILPARPVAMTPWSRGGDPTVVRAGRLPSFSRWLVVTASRDG